MINHTNEHCWYYDDELLHTILTATTLKVEHLTFTRWNLRVMSLDSSWYPGIDDVLDALRTSNLRRLSFTEFIDFLFIIELITEYNLRVFSVTIHNCYLVVDSQKLLDFFTANLTMREVNITYTRASEYDPYRPNHSMHDRAAANRYQADADHFTAFLQQIRKITTRNQTIHDNALAAAYMILMMQKFRPDSVFGIINRDAAGIIASFILDSKFDLCWVKIIP